MKENYTEKRMVNRKDNYRYFTIENILGIMQIIVVIISGFMVLYKKDNLGLHDILTKTVVKER